MASGLSYHMAETGDQVGGLPLRQEETILSKGVQTPPHSILSIVSTDGSFPIELSGRVTQLDGTIKVFKNNRFPVINCCHHSPTQSTCEKFCLRTRHHVVLLIRMFVVRISVNLIIEIFVPYSMQLSYFGGFSVPTWYSGLSFATAA